MRVAAEINERARGEMTPTITFRPLTHEDLPMLHEWLSRPHIADWWGAQEALAEIIDHYAPVIGGTSHVKCYIAFADDTPIGFIQSYVPAADHTDGWWVDEHDPGVRGIDQFLADGNRLGQGLGTAMIRAFVAMLFADPTVTRIQLDPSPDNARAIRAYEKAGFCAIREMETPDGRALLMYRDRTDIDPEFSDNVNGKTNV